MTKKRELAIRPEEIERSIVIVRGQRVMFDSDLARMYGVTTKELNQAVRRNAKRFPNDFAFRLTPEEFADLRSQIVTSKTGRGGRRYQPWVFTEHGVAMLSSVLRSPRAIAVNIEIVRAFVRLRRLLATPSDIVQEITRLARQVDLHDDKIKTIFTALERLLAPPERDQESYFGFRKPDRVDGRLLTHHPERTN
jgi:hypothetical protein